MAINANVIICGDLRMEITGKAIVVGMYNGNLSIPVDGTLIGRLVFMFLVDTPLPYIPQKMKFEVLIPGMTEPTRSEAALMLPPAEEKHTRFSIRHAVGVANIDAHSGKIIARAWADDQELEISTPWIVIGEPTFLVPSNVSPPPSEQSTSFEQETAPQP